MKFQAIIQAAQMHRHNKQAAVPPTFHDAIQQSASQQLRSDAMRDIMTLSAAGLGAGVGLRGLMGLLRLGHTNLSANRAAKVRPSAITVPIPVREREEKTANSAIDFLTGGSAQSKTGIPLYMPALVGGPAIGGLAGWKAMDWLLDKRRRGQMAAEVEDARREYEAALMEARGIKAGEHSSLGQVLDQLYDAVVEKTASGTMTDLGGMLLGSYLLAGGAAAGLTGASTYGWAKKRRRRKIVEDALTRIKRKQQLLQPPPVFLQAVPTRPGQSKSVKGTRFSAAPSLAEQEGQLDREVAR